MRVRVLHAFRLPLPTSKFQISPWTDSHFIRFSFCVCSWLYVLITVRLAQSTNGLSKIFIFFTQTAFFMLGGATKALSWCGPRLPVTSFCFVALLIISCCLPLVAACDSVSGCAAVVHGLLVAFGVSRLSLVLTCPCCCCFTSHIWFCVQFHQDLDLQFRAAGQQRAELRRSARPVRSSFLLQFPLSFVVAYSRWLGRFVLFCCGRLPLGGLRRPPMIHPLSERTLSRLLYVAAV